MIKLRTIQDAPRIGVIKKARIKKAVKEVSPTEAEDQIKLVVWLRKQNIPVVASANGGKRNFFEAMKLKRMGVSAGFPDLFIPVPNSSYHGLLIELKRGSGGKASESQLEWQKILRQNGYFCEIVYGLEDAKILIERYMEMV